MTTTMGASEQAVPLKPEPIRTSSSVHEAAVVIGVYVICIGVALCACALLVSATGGSARAVFTALLDGSFRAPGRWGDTIGVAIPLLIVALGTTISGRAGLVNIGQEGQLTVGAAVACYVGVNLPGPGVFVLFALLIGGMVGGGAWAGIAGALRYRRRVPEVLTTLLLITVATQLVGWGLNKTWLLLADFSDRTGDRSIISDPLPANSRLPRATIFGNSFPISAFIALALALVVGLVLSRSVWGFRLRMLGLNPRTAQRAGVSEKQYGMTAILVSGAFAGLAGAFMLAGGDFGVYRLTPGFAVSIGFNGLLVALVARQNALAALPIALVFAALRTGSGFLAATGVERQITDIVQSLLVLALLIPPAILFLRQRRRALAATRART